MENLKVSELAVFENMNCVNEEGKIRVTIIHKPSIGNIWIDAGDEENRRTLISFRDYASYCKYVGSDAFLSLFVIEKFIQ